MAIDPISSPLRLQPSAGSAATATTPAAGGFAAALGHLIASADSTAADANQAITGMVEGTGDVHDAMIAMQKAQMTLELTVQVRNKLVQAYQDVMRMTI
jgi:flagellar hook-basal body complex protein FliE